jgi:hypothetical protein
MKFSDPSESDKVLGPLYATAAKTEVPIFGPDKFTSKTAQQLLNATIIQNLRSENNSVVNLLSTKKPRMGHELSNISQSGGSLSEDLDKLQLEAQEDAKAKLTTSKKISSNRQLHEEAHYTSRLDSTSAESKDELLDHVMLQRAIDGYLFDCKINKAIVRDDVWSQYIWEWIEGK